MKLVYERKTISVSMVVKLVKEKHCEINAKSCPDKKKDFKSGKNILKTCLETLLKSQIYPKKLFMAN